MARPFLFGGSAQQAQSKYLVEFKAGKMQMKGKMVHAIDRKGTVYLNQTDDGLIHFCWKDRTTGQTEDDLIVFPDDAEFKRVEACKDGRVYVLKFKSNTRSHFYWLQEPSDEKDEENCGKVNEYLNNPPAQGSRNASSSGGLGSLADITSMNDSDLQNLLNNMSPQQMMHLLGGVGGLQSGGLASLLGAGSSSPSRQRTSAAAAPAAAPTTAAPTTTSTTSSQNQGSRTSSTVSASSSGSSTNQPSAAIRLSDLQNIISGLTVPPATPAGSGPPADQPNIDLSRSINLEALKPLLSNQQFMDRVKEHLPPDVDAEGKPLPVNVENASEQLAGTVSSPQFQQALSIFSAALQSGQLGPLIQQFNLGQECVDAANKGDLEAFIKALDKKKSSDKSSESGSKKDDDMALD